jgi:hypothetical protein
MAAEDYISGEEPPMGKKVKLRDITIEEVRKAEGGNTTFYVIEDEDGEEYTSFAKSAYTAAKKLEGEEVEIGFVKNGEYLNLVSINGEEYKEKKSGKGKGGGKSKGGGGKENPARQEAIERQSARRDAVSLVAALIAADKVEVSDDPTEVFSDLVEPLANAMWKSISKKAKKSTKKSKKKEETEEDPFDEEEDED